MEKQSKIQITDLFSEQTIWMIDLFIEQLELIIKKNENQTHSRTKG